MAYKKYRKGILVLFAGASLFLAATSAEPAEVISLGQGPPAVRDKKTQTVEYVCPMHPEVKAKSLGKCPKCDMTLVKRKVT